MSDIYYGSNVADATLTNACDCARNTTGGTETSQTTSLTGNLAVYEITSRGLTIATVASVPATPTGKGWTFKFTQNGTIAAGNYSAIMNLAAAWALSNQTTTIVRFFYLPGGVFGSAVLLASLAAVAMTSQAKTQYSWVAVAGSAQSVSSGDYLYVDAWANDTIGGASDNPVAYESNSSSSGVANDAQFTVPGFIISASSPTIPGAVVGPSISNEPLWRPPSRLGPVRGRINGKFQYGKGLAGKHPFRHRFFIF